MLTPASGHQELMSVVTFGARETHNHLSHMGYNNVNMLQDIEPVSFQLIRQLSVISPGEHDGDFVDALIVATDILNRVEEDCNKVIYLITGVYSRCNTSDLENLQPRFEDDEIGLNVIGVNFAPVCDMEMVERLRGNIVEAVKEEEEEDELEVVATAVPPPDNRVVPRHKKQNETDIVNFVAGLTRATFHPMDEGLRILSHFRVKTVRQVPTFTGNLEFGDVAFPVRMYVKAKVASMPSFKKLSAFSQLLTQQKRVERLAEAAAAAADGRIVDNDEENIDDLGTSMNVKMQREYVGVIEPDKQFARDSLVRAFRYGKTLVPFTKDQLALLNYKAERTLQVLGFVLRSALPRSYFMSAAELVAVPPGDLVAQKALASLCLAMQGRDGVKFEDDQGQVPNGLDGEPRAALVRLVKQKAGGKPQLGCLLPCIKDGRYYGFYYHRLPFCEDLRMFGFPPLVNPNPDSSKVAVRESWMQTGAQHNAIGALIDALDLDDEESPSHTPNPVLLNLFETARTRVTLVPPAAGNVVDPSIAHLLPNVDGRPALTLEEARRVPGITPAVRAVLEPPKDIWSKPEALSAVEHCRQLFSLEPVSKKSKKGKQVWEPSDMVAAVAASGGAGIAAMGATGAAGAAASGGIPQLTSYQQDSKEASGGKGNKGGDWNGAGGKKDPKLKMTLNQLLQGSGVDSVGTVSPCQDFENMIQRRDVDKVDEAVAQMEEVVRGLIAGSVHGHLFGKAIECLQCLRHGCVLEGEADRFNLYLRSLKAQHLGNQFWQAVVLADVTLIHEEESGDSEVSRQDADQFLRNNAPSVAVSEPPPADDSDEVDLFGQME